MSRKRDPAFAAAMDAAPARTRAPADHKQPARPAARTAGHRPS
ncbi:hypothetical protein ABZZ20_30715 [Streptomyces sp. NPDC006430]